MHREGQLARKINVVEGMRMGNILRSNQSLLQPSGRRARQRCKIPGTSLRRKPPLKEKSPFSDMIIAPYPGIVLLGSPLNEERKTAALWAEQKKRAAVTATATWLSKRHNVMQRSPAAEQTAACKSFPPRSRSSSPPPSEVSSDKKIADQISLEAEVR